MSKEKVVLAYSGGLDTSVCVKWLQDEKNLDVVCVCGNVGQEETGLDAKKQKALDLGVLDCQVLDLRDEFSDEFLTKAIAANSMYENKYPLLSALSRPLLAKKLVEVAHEFGATSPTAAPARVTTRFVLRLPSRPSTPSLRLSPRFASGI